MTPEGRVPLELDDIQSGVLRPRPTPMSQLTLRFASMTAAQAAS